MNYRITKECGVAWRESCNVPLEAWGVSKEQYTRAQKVAPEDVLLHYIYGIRAWGGYSTVAERVNENTRDKNTDWRAALPYAITLKNCVWLDVGQAETTVDIPDLPAKHYHRQVTFTSIPESEAQCVIAAIDKAKTLQVTPSPKLEAFWNAGADAYYWEIEKALAKGKCRLCGDDVSSWMKRISQILAGSSLTLSGDQLSDLRDSFVDVAHIIAKADAGPLMPNNVRALCPTCHRVIDRLPKDVGAQVMNSLKWTIPAAESRTSHGEPRLSDPPVPPPSSA